MGPKAEARGRSATRAATVVSDNMVALILGPVPGGLMPRFAQFDAEEKGKKKKELMPPSTGLSAE